MVSMLLRCGEFGRILGAAVFAAVVCCGPAVGDADPFVTPPSLVGHVDFWKQIFSTYSRDQIVIHDTENPSRIYSILDFSAQAKSLSEGALRKEVRRAEKAEKARIRGVLEKLQRNPDSSRLSVEEMRIRSLLQDDPRPDRYRLAAGEKRVRSQRGVRERFMQGLRRSRRYIRRMEEVFRSEGVPVGLTRLPLVESSFNTHAYSKVGAAGMWQFMPATGRKFLRIDGGVDERLDPMVSTRAAARFLRQNYERLGHWPLAITAYNHGPAGMERAVRSVGTVDLGKIVAEYESRTFGFASKNFYTEFLAALEIDSDYESYFGPMALDSEEDADEVELAHFVSVRSIGPCVGSLDDWKSLNPAVRPAAFQGKRWLPRGYRVRLRGGEGPEFRRCYDGLPSSAKRASHPVLERVHRVRSGETLLKIARRYRVSMESIRRANRLRNRNLIRIGQKLKIPGAGVVAASAPTRKAAAPHRVTHRVTRGQTLAQIGRRYGRSVESLRRANGLRDANRIRVGQRLRIPAR